MKVAELAGDCAEGLLDDVGGVGRLQPGPSAPAVHPAAVDRDEPFPGDGIAGLGVAQQPRGGRAGVTLRSVNVGAFHGAAS
jgi:hypothetical protein